MTSQNDHGIIKKFWDQKAAQLGGSINATLGETYLRKLEIKTMTHLIKNQGPKKILEIGCGDGYSTFKYAEKFPEIQFFATDYSENMIKVAKNKFSKKNIIYDLWDITNINEFPFQITKFDLIISQRVIQNLTSWEIQKQVINNLLELLAGGGHLILMECCEEGVAQVQKWRKLLERRQINNIVPWYNKFIIESEFKKEFGKNLIKIIYFSSSYMFVTRLGFSRLAGVARLLPSIGRFGYERVYILRKSAEDKLLKE